eukprot:gnl/TRDRNA2_/TRDRNA2_164349_c0_seq1.p1 gnl/TRDRNA2_/TRDRNA2_164349_c0~~gnl/TRDRNA2_/TRDRNA2_164349_c0_seq1.p1  ORF type:complete len:255 (+),score=41.65 gnl/TRDRNA2_/TRDRNA2_164349_c0_seq1:220-984(+)
MHPVSIAYLTWTFSRPQVIVPEFLEAVGNHLVDGLIPMLDRCGLCTLIWAYWKMGTTHKPLFDAAAQEIKRPERLRSLAPRNFQNTMIAFSRMAHTFDLEAEVVDRLAQGIQRLCDEHDPKSPKLRSDVCFPYTCLDGSRVDADAFRIGSLGVISRAFDDIQASGPHVERCFISMADYVLRSMYRSPQFMRDAGDAADFLTTFARVAARMPALKEHIDPFIQDLPNVIRGANRSRLQQLEKALWDAGLDVQLTS